MWNLLTQRVKLDWVQIEVSSACNCSCLYCPQTAYRDVWQKRLLDPEVLENILPFLHPDTYIHLQGWGEPFLHPRLLFMIETIKKNGFKVGTTTNGTLLNADIIGKLVDSGLDLLAFSTAGCSGGENDPLRRGATLKNVIRCAEILQAVKASRKSSLPKLHIAQMLLQSNLAHIDAYPAFWKNLGVDQVVLSSLSLVGRAELQEQAILANTIEEWEEMKQRFFELREQNGLSRILHFHLISPFQLFKGCSENIQKSAVIGSDGSVSPCVMVNLSVSGPVMHWAYGKRFVRKNISWGNLMRDNFSTIWRRKGYKGFRKSEEMEGEQCRNCLKRCAETMETAYRMDLSSTSCRRQVIQEAKEEREAIRRMERKMASMG